VCASGGRHISRGPMRKAVKSPPMLAVLVLDNYREMGNSVCSENGERKGRSSEKSEIEAVELFTNRCTGSQDQ
jgi:hypothetical protein